MKWAAWPLGLLLAAETQGSAQPAVFKQATFPSAAIGDATSQPEAVVSGDWNADKRTDLAVADSKGNRVSILFGDGNNTFIQAIDIAVGATPVALVSADLNLDGTVDLAVLKRG